MPMSTLSRSEGGSSQLTSVARRVPRSLDDEGPPREHDDEQRQRDGERQHGARDDVVHLTPKSSTKAPISTRPSIVQKMESPATPASTCSCGIAAARRVETTKVSSQYIAPKTKTLKKPVQPRQTLA